MPEFICSRKLRGKNISSEGRFRPVLNKGSIKNIFNMMKLKIRAGDIPNLKVSSGLDGPKQFLMQNHFFFLCETQEKWAWHFWHKNATGPCNPEIFWQITIQTCYNGHAKNWDFKPPRYKNRSLLCKTCKNPKPPPDNEFYLWNRECPNDGLYSFGRFRPSPKRIWCFSIFYNDVSGSIRLDIVNYLIWN